MHAQNFNSENIAFSNFLVRMYENAPFEGIRIIEDYEQTYLISVLTLDRAKYNDESIMNRVACIKAQSQAAKFFNGSQISDEVVIKISESQSTQNTAEIIETIKERSSGYIKAMQLIATKHLNGNRELFIFIVPIS